MSVLIGNSFDTITGTRRLNDIMYEAVDKLINVQVLQQQAAKEGLYPTPDQQAGPIAQAKQADLAAESDPNTTFDQFLKDHNITEAQYNRRVTENVIVLIMADHHMP